MNRLEENIGFVLPVITKIYKNISPRQKRFLYIKPNNIIMVLKRNSENRYFIHDRRLSSQRKKI